ncbi:MAG: aldo/keto reductase [Betaproteobacteria bacterium]
MSNGPATGFAPEAVRLIPRTQLAVSQLGVGCAPFGSLDAGTSEAGLHDAFADLYADGLRYFDVAPLYGSGLAEHRLGACLRSIDRRTVVLSTKVGRLLQPEEGPASPGAGGRTYPFTVGFDYSYDGTMRSLEHSMQRLGTNAIDIALIHDVNRRWQGDLVDQRYGEAMKGAYKALATLRESGAIQAIGVGVNDWTILERFAADGDFDCFMLAGRYTLLDHTALDTFLPECARRRIAVLMAAPFNSGILATGARPGATFFYAAAEPEIVARTQRIETVCARHGVAIGAAALQFPLAHPAIASVVTGMRSREEVAANLAHCRAIVPPAFWDELKHERLIAAHAPVGSGGEP